MVTITERAHAKILELLAAESRAGLALRWAVTGRGPGGWQYQLGFVAPEERRPDDRVVDGGGFEVFVDPESAGRLEGASLDFVEELMQSGFRIENPTPLWSDPVALEVQKVLDEDINPAVASHGGWVALLDVRDDTAYIQMGGGCQGCGMANVTLRQGVEVRIRERVPGIQNIVDTTDHAGGTNPYYQPAKGGGPSPLA